MPILGKKVSMVKIKENKKNNGEYFLMNEMGRIEKKTNPINAGIKKNNCFFKK